MTHRIRASALIVRDNRLLLVNHVHPKTGFSWWIPPGGGLEDADSSIFDGAARETCEETALIVTCSRIAYIGEFEDPELKLLNIEFFLPADTVEGEPGLENIGPDGLDALYIKDVRWFTREALADVTVFPELLRDRFWSDRREGFPCPQYFGRRKGRL